MFRHVSIAMVSNTWKYYQTYDNSNKCITLVSDE